MSRIFSFLCLLLFCVFVPVPSYPKRLLTVSLPKLLLGWRMGEIKNKCSKCGEQYVFQKYFSMLVYVYSGGTNEIGILGKMHRLVLVVCFLFKSTPLLKFVF